jgi:hypothetical protein
MTAKKTGKAVLSMKDLQKQMTADATDASARTAAIGGNTIGIRNSKFSFKNNVIGRTLNAVVVDYVHCNAWYGTPWDADNPAPPDCVALSADGEDMGPVKGCSIPGNETCDGCEKNAWGSADVGRGKACGEQYKLALIAPGPGEDYSSSEIAILTFPPTSRKAWTQFVKDISEKLQRPPYGVITSFSFESDAEWPILEVELHSKVAKIKDLNDILERRAEARDLLMTPPDFSGFVPPTSKKKTKKKASKKKVATKKASKKKASKKASKKSKYA